MYSLSSHGHMEHKATLGEACRKKESKIIISPMFSYRKLSVAKSVTVNAHIASGVTRTKTLLIKSNAVLFPSCLWMGEFLSVGRGGHSRTLCLLGIYPESALSCLKRRATVNAQVILSLVRLLVNFQIILSFLKLRAIYSRVEWLNVT